MSEQWYYTKGRQKVGPISADELKQLAASGQLSRTDLVWTDGMPEWIPAAKRKGLFANRAFPSFSHIPKRIAAGRQFFFRDQKLHHAAGRPKQIRDR